MRLATTLLPWLATWLLHSALLCALALLVTRALRSPRAREVVWKGALLGAFATASLQALVGAAPLAARLEVPGPDLATAPEPGGGAPIVLDVDASGASAASPGAGGSVGEVARIVPAPPAAAPARPLPWPGLLLGLWLTVATARLLGLVRRQRQVRTLFRGRRPVADPRARALVARLLGDPQRAARVRLSVCPGLDAPLALGAREVVLPERAVELDEGELEGLLAHELAHLERRDPGWSLAAHLLERLFFPQLLLRPVRRRLAADAELCSDDWAAGRMRRPEDLARCLARVAGWLDTRPRRVPALAPGMAASRSALVERVERLLTPPAAGRGNRALAGTGVVLALAAVAWAGPAVSLAGQDADAHRLELVAVEPVGSGDHERLLYTHGELETTRLDRLLPALRAARARHPRARFGLDVGAQTPDGALAPLLVALEREGITGLLIVGDGPAANAARVQLAASAPSEVWIGVLVPGNRLDPETGAAWSGEGRHVFDGTRRVGYRLAGEPVGDLDTLVARVAARPAAPVWIDAGAGVVYEDVRALVAALAGARVTDVAFLGSDGRPLAGRRGPPPADPKTLEALGALGYVGVDEEQEELEDSPEEEQVPEPLSGLGYLGPGAAVRDPLRLDFGADGALRAGAEALVDPALVAGRPDPYAAVTTWLRAAAAGMHRSEHPLLGALPDDPLLLRAEPATPFFHLQRVMERCGAREVAVWNLHLAVGEEEALPLPLPIDPGIAGAAPLARVEVGILVKQAGRRLDAATRTPWNGAGPFEYDGTRELEYVVGRGGEEDFFLGRRGSFARLDDLRQELERMRRESPELRGATLDPRRGTTAGEVLSVVHLLRAAGFEPPNIVGARGNPAGDYPLEEGR